MPFFTDNIRAGASGVTSSYEIEKSLRFDNDSSAYLSRTAGSPTNQNKGTFSCWIKRTKIGHTTLLFGGGGGSQTNTNAEQLAYISGDTIASSYKGGLGGCSIGWYMYGTRKLMDTSAWMHVLVSFDWTQSGDSNRLKFYINGVQDTLNSCGNTGAGYQYVNVSGTTQYMGRQDAGSGPYYSHHYMADAYFIDGTVYTPSDFIETDSDTGVIVPKDSSSVLSAITLGNNGGYYNFSDTSDLGKDHSSNSNDFTAHNFSVSAGDGNDSTSDTPTNNKATLNSVTGWSSNATLKNGNLEMTGSSGFKEISSIAVDGTSKFYYEIVRTNAAGWQLVGVFVGQPNNPSSALTNTAIWAFASTQATYFGGSYTSTNDVPGWGNNDVVGIKYENGSLKLYKNGTLASASTSSVPTGDIVFAYIANDNTNAATFVRFNADSWTQDSAAGVDATWELSTSNMPNPTIKKPNEYFNTVLWDGNNTSGRTITGVGFAPDLTWLKCKSDSASHQLHDIVRGANKIINSNKNAAESNSDEYGYLSAFTSDGFTLTNGSNAGYPAGSVNMTGRSYVAWNWEAGSSTVTNTDGTISSQVRASPIAGFSIVSYEGNNTQGATVGHGLGVAPDVIIVKNRESSYNWAVWHTKLLSAAYVVNLNLTSAQGSIPGIFNSTAPTSTVFSLGGGSQGDRYLSNEPNKDFIAYCFSEVSSYSKFGSYVGNGSSDGTFIYLGFQPAWVMIKRISATEGWQIFDNKRDPDNVIEHRIEANTTEGDVTSIDWLDFLSNGIKHRVNRTNTNTSGSTYIYLAFAEFPFKYARAR